MKKRSLKSQFNYTISQNFVPGVSKRGDKRNHVNTGSRIYSNKTASKLRDTANVFAGWIKSNHPEIRMIREISSDIVQEFCCAKEKNWSWATRTEMISRIKKLQNLAIATYPGSKISFADHLDKSVFTENKTKGKIRDVAMIRPDYEKLNAAMENSRSKAKFSIHIAGATGARIEEICSIRPDQIDLEKCQIELTNCKNGRNRTVAFNSNEVDFFAHLIDHCRKNSWKTVVGDLKPAAVSRQIRRQIDKLYANKQISSSYANTTVHAIRKMYARERMCQVMGLEDISHLASVPLEDKIRGWIRVQRDLGHGSKIRKELYLAYIGEHL